MKKRSLFVATAMLLVAVLVATGATYAWFTSVETASSTMEMAVANGESLEISNKAKADGAVWKTSLNQDDFATMLNKSWTDLSTNDDELGTFYTEVYEAEGAANTITGYEASNNVAYATIYFRSSKPGVVKATGALSGDNLSANLLKALRVGIAGDASKIYATEAGVNNKAIGAADVNDQVVADVEGTATQTTAVVTAANDVITLADGNDGYYYGNATFYFWVEGTKCLNSDSAADLMAKASFVFEQ